MTSDQSAIVVTGVTRGLGRALVDEFVRVGHIVFGCARTASQIGEMNQKYPGHDFQVVDVASDEEVRAWAEHVRKSNIPIDFVINNAAVINLKAPLWKVGAQEFSDEIDINIKGVVNVIRHFVPPMIIRKHGVIVNFTSRWGTKFEKEMAPYCATKWAVVALTRVLAEELRAERVTAVGLNPGIVRTGMLQKYLGTTTVDSSVYPTPLEWAHAAVPYILHLGLKDSGKLLNLFKRSRSAVIGVHDGASRMRPHGRQEITP
jgi:NAD(P)-dependent dehydrogenase (short-subunit alcohol dehydrogenase family)